MTDAPKTTNPATGHSWTCNCMACNYDQHHPQTASDDDDGAWIIWFEDAEVAPEMFSGCGARDAAAARFEQMKIGWNCHLFQKVA